MKQSLICHSAFIWHPHILCKSEIILDVEKIIYFCLSWFCISISSKKNTGKVCDISKHLTVRNTGIIRVCFFFFNLVFQGIREKYFNQNFIDTSSIVNSSIHILDLQKVGFF